MYIMKYESIMHVYRFIKEPSTTYNIVLFLSTAEFNNLLQKTVFLDHPLKIEDTNVPCALPYIAVLINPNSKVSIRV